MKKSVMIILIVIILLASLILPTFTGRITYPFQLQQRQLQQQLITAFEEQAKEALKVKAPEERMVMVEKAQIEETALEKIMALPEDKCTKVIIWYKPEIVEKKVEEIKKLPALPIQFAQPARLPFKTAAALFAFPVPVKTMPTPSLPFDVKKLQEEMKEIAIEKLAIQKLHEEITLKLTPKQFADVHTYKNLEGASGCLFPEGARILAKEEVSIFKDFEFTTDVQDAIKFVGVDKEQERKVANQYIKGKDIVVAVIDSGVDYRHDNFKNCFGKGCKIIDGWNFIANDKNIIDMDGHGTHLAGIVESIAPEASIVALKVCEQGNCFASKISEAIDWCLDYGCNIGTLSLGDQQSHNPEECKKIETLKPVLETASSRGMALFVSSGNKGYLWPAYPACDPNVISVGSINDMNGKLSSFSNRHADIFAPGEVITSTWLNNEYKTMVGTSQAAAFAAGVGALYMQSYAVVKKTAPAVLLLEEQFETTGNIIYDPVSNEMCSTLNALNLIESLIGAAPLPSFVCGNFKCEFELGEDAQNCPEDCITVNVTNVSLKNYNISFEIKDWQNRIAATRVEIRNNLLKDFSYPDKGTEALPIEIPQGSYDIKISYGLFSFILKSINVNSSMKLKIKLEDLTQKIKELPGLSYAKVKAVYALGFKNSMSTIVCFDKQLAKNNTFVFRCSWNNKCSDSWKMLMSIKPFETSCILTMPGEGMAFAVVEIPEAACGNNFCEPGEYESCPEDCTLKPLKPLGEEKWTKWLQHYWLFIVITIAAMLAVITITLVRKKFKEQKPFVPAPPPPPLPSSLSLR